MPCSMGAMPYFCGTLPCLMGAMPRAMGTVPSSMGECPASRFRAIPCFDYHDGVVVDPTRSED